MTRARETSENARLAKAWVNFNGAFGTSPFTEANGGIRSSFNVSSVTDDGVGRYTINFTIPFSDGNYCVTTGLYGTNISSDMFLDLRVLATTYVQVFSFASNLAAERDSPIICVSIFR